MALENLRELILRDGDINLDELGGGGGGGGLSEDYIAAIVAGLAVSDSDINSLLLKAITDQSDPLLNLQSPTAAPLLRAIPDDANGGVSLVGSADLAGANPYVVWSIAADPAAADGYIELSSTEADGQTVRVKGRAGQTVPLLDLQNSSSVQVLEVTGDSKIGFYNAAPVAQQEGVTVDAAGIHAALVTLGLIAE